MSDRNVYVPGTFVIAPRLLKLLSEVQGSVEREQPVEVIEYLNAGPIPVIRIEPERKNGRLQPYRSKKARRKRW